MAAHDALRTILPVAGLTTDRARAVEITGGADPVLPTPFRIGETSAAALAATGLAASDLWELRTGRRQEVAVDMRQATASLRSGHYMKMEGPTVSTRAQHGHGRVSGEERPLELYPRQFPQPSRRRAAVLGVRGRSRSGAPGRGANGTRSSSRRRSSPPRAPAAWCAPWRNGREHPQAAAIASLPLLEIVKIGDSAPEKLPDGDRPLSGIRVLDLTRVLAGPTCARTLAEHGADVLKITGPHLPNIGYQEYDTGHGKLSAHLDLRQPKDLETLHGLVREADVFTQGYRPGTLGDRGLSPEELAQLRPGLVYVSLCAFSHVGPWASRRGFDTVVQTVSGITSRQGELFPGAEPGPQFYPVSAIDYLTGYLMAFGAMVALARRAREGGSWLVRISLAQIGRWLVGRGQVPETELKDVPKEFTADELARWSIDERDAGRSAAPSEPTVQTVGDAAALGPALGAARLQRAGVAGASLTPGNGGSRKVNAAGGHAGSAPTPWSRRARPAASA